MASTDKFANQAVITCVETAANTITFKKLETGIAMFEKMAWVISQVEYFVGSYASFNTTGDYVNFGLATTDQLTSLSLSNAAIFDFNSIQRLDIGAAASGELLVLPITKDFSSMPGGGIIVPPNPLYLGVMGSGMANAMTVLVKIYYINYQLKADEYWELVEARRIISS